MLSNLDTMMMAIKPEGCRQFKMYFIFYIKKKTKKTYFYINSHKKEFIILYKGIKYIVLVNNF